MTGRRFLLDRSGVAAAEMALILPLLIVLLFVGLEAGHFIWTQHRLAEAVRDGARYASRLEITDLCPTFNPTLEERTKLLTRTGQMDDPNAKPLVRDWSADEVTVSVHCGAFVETGIYSDMGGEKAPIVVVEAVDVPYTSLFKELGGIEVGIKLGAKSSAAVIGL